MKRSEAVIPTEHASSYLRKLCQHWSHRFAVEFDDQHGTIALPNAKCVLDADAAALRVDVQTEEGGDQVRMEQVVEEHLQRFGFRETLVFDWKRIAGA